MIYKVKTERDAIAFSLAENVTFGVHPKDGCLYVGTPEALQRAGVEPHDAQKDHEKTLNWPYF